MELDVTRIAQKLIDQLEKNVLRSKAVAEGVRLLHDAIVSEAEAHNGQQDSIPVGSEEAGREEEEKAVSSN